MKFFLDRADLEELRTGVSLEIVDGVSTNRTLIAREGEPFEEHFREIWDIVDGDVSAEVLESEVRPIIKQGIQLAKIHKNAAVKCPITREGIKATSEDWHKTFQEELAVR